MSPPRTSMASRRSAPLLRVGWILVGALLFAGLGAAYGLTRDPEYSAEARLRVGGVDLSAPGALAGYAEATSALAADYSRSIDADAIANPLARKLDLTTDEVTERVEATPIPDSAVLKVRATGADEDDTLQLGRAAARRLQRYAGRSLRAGALNARLIQQFRQATIRQDTAEREIALAGRRFGPSPADPDQRRQVQKLEADAEVARLRVRALRASFHQAQRSETGTAAVTLVSLPREADSDRASVTQLAGAFGFVAGGLIGGLLGALFSLARRRRPKKRT